MGYNYVQEMQLFLLRGQENALLLTASGIATVLNDRSDLFNPATGVPEVLGDKGDIYSHQLDNIVKLDGEVSDWQSVLDYTDAITGPTPYLCDGNYDPDSFSYRNIVAHYDNYLYALFDVDDDTIVYRDPQRPRLDTSDQIRLLLQLPNGTLKHYLAVAQKPGRMNIHLTDKDWSLAIEGKSVQAFIAFITETETGYRVELRMPRDIIGTHSKVGFFVVDVDDPKTRKIKYTLSTSPETTGLQTGKILLHSPELTKILHGLDQPNSRIWILDRYQRVRAVVGGLSAAVNGESNTTTDEPIDTWTESLSRWFQRHIDSILKRPPTIFADVSTDITHRPDEIFAKILTGEPQVQARPSLDRQAEIIVAGHPIKSHEEILGAVVVEQSSHVILSLQHNLLRSLTLLTFVVFAFITIVLLIFTWRLAIRIHRLRNTTEKAITAEGRVLEEHIPNRIYPKDELGDLGRSITSMLKKLYGYTRYLEAMPDTLAHEINNPINVVNSSLEILENDNPTTHNNKYIRRARTGIDRIRSILTNLTEAANLEDAMRTEVKEPLILDGLISEFIDGYKISHPDFQFQLKIENKNLTVNGSADHLAQMMDKLIDNAVQFSDSGSAIIIRLNKSSEMAEISVLNRGQNLPETHRDRLFDPMVSVGKKNAKQSHLGLGLYIVRLVSEFHQGEVRAENRKDTPGVCVTVRLPMLNSN